MNKVFNFLLAVYILIGIAYGNVIYEYTRYPPIAIAQGLTWPMSIGILLAESYNKLAKEHYEN